MAFPLTVKFPLLSTPAPIFTDLWDEDDTTQSSDTTAFNEGIDERDDGTTNRKLLIFLFMIFYKYLF